MLVFSKVNDNLFRVEPNQELVDRIEAAIKTVTLCDSKLFSNEIEGELRDKLVSRLVASDFKSTYPNYLENNSIFIKILVPYNNKTVSVSYGEILYNNEVKVLNGVIY